MDELKLVNEKAKWNPCPLYQFSSNTRNFEPIHFARPGSLSTGIELGNVDMEKFSIVTLNILFDHYDKEKIFTEKRYPLVLELLEQLDADIIALQEVTTVFLKFLVKSTWIINNNYYITEIPAGPTCDPYGNIIISKYPFAFEMCRYSPTKRAIAGFWKINNKIFGIPVVHLISNQGGGPKRREKELKVIWNHLSKVADEILIVGDFNFREVDEDGNSVTQDNKLIDVWKHLYPNHEGISFNPLENLICKETSERGLPFRYDRMYLKSRNWKPRSMEIIANNPTLTKVEEKKEMNLYPSDHFGLFASYEFCPANKRPENNIPTFINTFKLNLDENQLKERNDILDHLRTLLEPLGQFKLQPIGSYLLGCATPSSDIDVICLGTLPTTQFSTKAHTLINSSPQVKHVRNVSDALVPIMVIHFSGGVKIELQYGCVLQSEPLDPNLNIATTFTFQKMSKLDSSTVRVINGFFDTDIILNAVPDKKVYSQALSFIKAWAKNNAIDNNKMGFIGGLGWAIMLAHVHEKSKSTTPEDLVKTFFKTFAEWDWENTPVALSCVTKIPEHDPEREWLPILQPTRPYRVITRNSTLSTANMVKYALTSTYEKIKKNPEIEFEDLCTCVTLPNFKACKAFVRVTLNSNKRNDFINLVNFAESRFVSLICQFETKFKQHILLHPLPKPLVNKSPKHLFSWYYLFGIYHVDDPYGERDFDFVNFLQGFENELNTWQAKTDQMFISVEQIERKYLPKIYYQLSVKSSSSSSSKRSNSSKNSPRGSSSPSSSSPLSTSPLSTSPLSSGSTFFSGVSENNVSFSFGGSSDNNTNIENNTNTDNNTNEISLSSPQKDNKKSTPKKDNKKDSKKDNKNKKNKGKNDEDEDDDGKGSKLRPAQEIYKKIKFNPQIDPSQFIIGYMDRFTGMQEIVFDEFLADKLNPKGIPMHRIWYFKKNGEIVWDREKRIDKFEKEDEESDD